MTRDEIITIVLNRCGNQAGNTGLATALESELDLIQLRLEEAEELPWFLITEWASKPTVANQSRISLPDDFLMEVEESHLYVIDDDGKEHELTKDDHDALKEAYKDSDAALPEKYALIGPYFRLFPAPDAAYTLRMMYYAQQSTLTASTSTNAWTTSAPDLLIGELGVITSGQYHKDQTTKDNFLTDLARAQRRLTNKRIAREEANHNRTMGD